ncbi:sensor histidine kinase [Microbacterium sp.]|jgi:signal transduction histidine kinase|uniref:sensor histidine kinase n=1 Tax=Microbacterium sp. TaxID=51671 RepID=UPI0037CA4F96
MVTPRLSRRREAWLRIAAAAAAIVLVVVSVALGASLYDGLLLVLFVGVLAQVASLPLALIRPRVAAMLSIAGALVIMGSAHAGAAPWPWAVTTMITQALVLAALGYRASWLLGAGTLIGVVALSGVLALLVVPSRDQESVAVNLVVFACIGGIAVAVGNLAREWQAVGQQLVRERRLTEDERARRLVAEEKTRIARELHDIVAHSMSTITIQATSAQARLPQVDAPTRHEFDEIAALSRKALSEMRSLLGVLREPDVPIARTPQPRLSGIAELVKQSQRSGLQVRLRGADSLSDEGVDEAVGLSAYRIVQEALSNVRRHTRGAAVEVRVHRDQNLDLRVRNRSGASRPGTEQASHPNPPTTEGSGLLGMRERAAGVGGTLSFGPTGDGGYEIHAVLPLHVSSESKAE